MSKYTKEIEKRRTFAATGAVLSWLKNRVIITKMIMLGMLFILIII